MAKEEPEQKEKQGVDLAAAEGQLNKEIAKFENAKEAYDTMEADLEENFKKDLDSLLSDEEREIMLDVDNVAGQYELMMQKRKAYVTDKMDEEKAVLEAFESDIEQKQAQIQTLKAEESFRQNHPDSDFEKMQEFFDEDLTTREKKELLGKAEGDPEALMKLVHDAYVEKSGTPNEEDVELPTDLSDIAGETGDLDNGDGDVDDADYLASVGL